jgi:D-alanyl-D-alanine carboxypeptidase
MTSGLVNYTETESYLERLLADPTGTMTLDEIIAFANDPSVPAPSKRGDYYYCNTNYIILGKIIESLTNRSVGDELQTRLFTPLGLTGTGYGADPTLPAPSAHGYGYAGEEGEDAEAPSASPEATPAAAATIFDAPPDAGGLIDLTEVNASSAGPAGAAWSTAADLAAWLPALYDGATLSPELQRERLTLVPIDPANPAAGGYGLGIAEFGGGLWGHNGDFFGASCIAVRDPNSGLILIAITNLFPAKGDVSSSQAIVTAVSDTLRQ